jgi:hypothetical protein
MDRMSIGFRKRAAALDSARRVLQQANAFWTAIVPAMRRGIVVTAAELRLSILAWVILCACSSPTDEAKGSAGNGSLAQGGGSSRNVGLGGMPGTAAGGESNTLGKLTYEWSVVDAPTGNAMDCRRSGIDLFVLQLGAGLAARESLDSCDAGHSSISAIAGTYDVNVSLKNLAGLIFGGASRGLTTVGAGEVVALDPFRLALHTLRFPWSVSKAGQPSDCGAVGASTVQIHWVGSFAGAQVSHSCAKLTSDYVILGAGPYALDGTLLSASGSKLASWQMHIALPESGEPELPTVAFDVP